MSMTVGQLVATFDVDTRPAVTGITRAESMIHGLADDAEATGRRIHAGLDEALSELPAVTITADSSEADREVDALRQRLMVLRDTRIGVDVTTEQAQHEIDAVRAQLTALSIDHPTVEVQASVRDAVAALNVVMADSTAVNASDPSVQVHADTGAATRGLAQVAIEAEAVGHLDPHINVHTDTRGVGVLSRALSGLTGMFSSLASGAAGSLASVAKLPVMLAVGVPIAAALVQTIGDILPAASLAATGIFAVLSATFALKIGMSGVGDAVKAAFAPGATAADLKKALDGLAPSARTFVLALRSMKPQFDALKLDVQGRLFAGLASTATHLGTTVLPTVRGALVSAAGALNLMALGVAGAANNLGTSGTLGKALAGANAGLRNMSGIPGMIVTALGQLGAAAAPQFAKLTAAAADAAAKVSGKLNAAFTSGALGKSINTAVGIVKQLGGVLKNIGSIIGSVFKAAQAGGGGLVNTLSRISGALATSLSSPAVQAGMTAVFGMFGELSKLLAGSLGPMIGQIASAFGQVAPVVTTLLKSLGNAAPVVALILLRFNPLLGILSLLAPVMGQLAKPIASVVQGLAPLIEAVGTFSGQLGKALVPIVTGLAPVLSAAAGAVGALLTAFSPLLPVLGTLIGQLLPVFTPIFTALTTIFLALAKPIQQIATALGQALKPVIAALTGALTGLVATMLPMFLQALNQLLPVIPMMTPVLIQLGQSIGQILAAVLPLLPQIDMLSIRMITMLLPAIIPLIPPMAQLVTLLLRLATEVITKIVVPAMQLLVDFMGGLQKKLQPAIDAITWVTTHIAKAFEWLSDHLVGHSVIPDMIRSIVSWFTGLPGKATRALASLGSKIAGVVEDAAGRMTRKISDGVSAAVKAVKGMPGKAKAALGDLGGYLYKSGKALLQGFADGIKSMGSAVKDAATSVLGKAKGLFPNSPAKEGPFSGSGWTYHSGKATGRDWAAGLLDQQDAVGAAAAALMGSASDGLAGSGGLGSFGVAGGGAGGMSAAGGGGQMTVRIVVDGPDAMKRLIRSIVKNDGNGSVQKAFGRTA